jgi:hypothetical protein
MGLGEYSGEKKLLNAFVLSPIKTLSHSDLSELNTISF